MRFSDSVDGAVTKKLCPRNAVLQLQTDNIARLQAATFSSRRQASVVNLEQAQCIR